MTVVIQRKRKPSGYLIPAGGEIVWYGLATALPAGFVIDAYCSNVFVRGADTNGSSNTPASDVTHGHTNPAATSTSPAHSHSTGGNLGSALGSTTIYPTSNADSAGVGHGHGAGGTSSSAAGHSHTLSSVVAATVYPPYKRLYWIKATVDVSLPIGGILMWDNPIAGIPVSWKACDGANGTPDLRDKFIYGAAADGDVGATGGAETHSHNNVAPAAGGAHNHSFSGGSGGADSNHNVSGYAAGIDVAAGGHSHSISGTLSNDPAHSHTLGDTGLATSIPVFLKLYFVMRTV